jgi:hypothetical protein
MRRRRPPMVPTTAGTTTVRVWLEPPETAPIASGEDDATGAALPVA